MHTLNLSIRTKTDSLLTMISKVITQNQEINLSAKKLFSSQLKDQPTKEPNSYVNIFDSLQQFCRSFNSFKVNLQQQLINTQVKIFLLQIPTHFRFPQVISMGCQESFISKDQPLTGRAKAGELKKKVKKGNKNKKCDKLDDLQEGKYDMTDEDWNMVQNSLINHNLLFKAKGYANKQIMNRLQLFHAKASQMIFKKGDPSNYFYIIVRGSVEISNWAQGQKSKVLKRGDCFGDQGIYNKTTRSASATARTQIQLLGLQKDNFLRISLEFSKRAQNEVFRQIKNIPIFKSLTLQQKHKLSYLAQQLKFKKDTVIFKKGQISNCLYIVKSGKVLLKIPGKQVLQVKAKQSFGQSCLNQQKQERCADAICVQNSILLTFSKSQIQKYLDRQLFDLETVNKLIWAFKHNKNLQVAPLVLDTMIQIRQIHYFMDKQIIAEKGQRITHLLVSLEGGISNHAELQVVNTDYLLDIKYQTQNLIKNGAGEVVFIQIAALQKQFNRNFNSLIDLNQHIWKQIESIAKIQQYVSKLALSQFFVVETKGVGNFGCTLKVKSQSNLQFALRVIEKSKVIREGEENKVSALKDIGYKLYHSLIAKQYCLYEDKHRVYFMNRWVEGQDLFDLVQRMKKLNINMAKHFAACIISIMEYLHRRRVVWRELKIQSFVIDSEGYLNLIDLMYLQEIPEEQSFISNPAKATYYYLAPEILSSQGHGFQTDFWSLGVLLYRLIIGEFPFGTTISTQSQDVLEQLLEQIQNKTLDFPKWVTSDVKILLKMLLNPNPMERSLISFSKLKSLTFFKGYDWLGLIEKKVKSIPYIPKIQLAKNAESISLTSWLEHQVSETPPSSSLDLFLQTKKSQKH